MADYHPLIARAVQGLPDPAPEMRAAVYDRARTALFRPACAPSIPRSRKRNSSLRRDALETAIASVEAAYSGAARPDESGEVSPASGGIRRDRNTRRKASPCLTPADSAPDNGVQAADAPPPGLAPTGTYHPAYQEPEHQELPPYRGTDTAVEASPEVTGPAMTPPRTPPISRRRLRRPQVQPRSQPANREKLGRASIRCLQRTAPAVACGLRSSPPASSRVIGVIAFVAYWLKPGHVAGNRHRSSCHRNARPGAAAEETHRRNGSAETPAIPGEERVEAGGTRSGAACRSARRRPEGGVAQRAILYEEDASAPSGEPRASAGGAVWELVPPEDGENDPRVRARVQFPDVDLTMTMVMERNLDPTLPASHTVLITFETDGREKPQMCVISACCN